MDKERDDEVLENKETPWRSFLDKLRRYVFGDDIFLSYARADGVTYASGLANKLATLGYACRIDLWGTEPGEKTPKQVIRALRASAILVVIGTSGSKNSTGMRDEIRAYKSTGRQIIPIQVDGVIEASDWWPLLHGLPITAEEAGRRMTLEARKHAGEPSERVVDRIVKSFSFQTKQQRLQRTATATLGVIMVLIVGAVSLLWFAQDQGRKAIAASNRAEAANMATSSLDILVNSPDRVRDAARLALQSLQLAKTSWGESALRDSLLNLPHFLEKIETQPTKKHPYLASLRFPSQNTVGIAASFIRWNYVEDHSLSEPYFYFEKWTEKQQFRKHDYKFKGSISDVQAFADGKRIAVISSNDHDNRRNTLAILNFSDDQTEAIVYPSGDISNFSLLKNANKIVTVNSSSIKLWSTSKSPKILTSWPLENGNKIVSSPDETHLYIADRKSVWRLLPNQESQPEKLFDHELDDGLEIAATLNHVIVSSRTGTRTFNLTTRKWDHDELPAGWFFNTRDEQILIYVKEKGEVHLYDLAESGTSFYVDHRLFECARNDGNRIKTTAISVSGDARYLALGCATGLVPIFDLLGGARLAIIPLEDTKPVSIWFNSSKDSVRVYSERHHTSVNKDIADISEWHIPNKCEAAILEGFSDHASEAALSADGSVLAQISRDGFKIWKTETAIQLGTVSFDSDSFYGSVGPIADNGRAAIFTTGFGRQKNIWTARNPYQYTDLSSYSGQMGAASFGGPDDQSIILSEYVSTGETEVIVRLLTLEDGKIDTVKSLRAGGWWMNAQPDNIFISAVALSNVGSFAYMAPPKNDTASDDPESFRTIILKRTDRESIEFEFSSPVAALAFSQNDELLVGLRNGEIHAIRNTNQTNLIGKHDNPIRIITNRSGSSDIIAVDAGNILRAWSIELDYDQVGIKGFMETPLSELGISGHGGLGVKSLAFNENFLLTITKYGDYTNRLQCWNMPLSKNLIDEAQQRLGLEDGAVKDPLLEHSVPLP